MKYQEIKQMEENDHKVIGIRLNNHLTHATQKIDTQKELTDEQIGQILSEFNSENVKPHLFKFIHDLFMVFPNENKEIFDL